MLEQLDPRHVHLSKTQTTYPLTLHTNVHWKLWWFLFFVFVFFFSCFGLKAIWGGGIKKKKIKAVTFFGDISAGWLLLRRPTRDRAANRMVNYKEFPFPWSQAQKPTGRLLPLRRTSDFWRWAVWSTAHKMWANTRKTKGDSFAPQWNQGPRAYPNPNLERCHLPPPNPLTPG